MRFIQKPLDRLHPRELLSQFLWCHVFNRDVGQWQMQRSDLAGGNQELNVQRQDVKLNHWVLVVVKATPNPIAQLLFQAGSHMALVAKGLLVVLSELHTIRPATAHTSALGAFGQLVQDAAGHPV